MFKEGSDSITAIVQFPAGLNIPVGSRFNVFNEKGDKVGFFKVTVAKLKSSEKNYENYGGAIKLIKGKLLRRGFRVTTLMSVPDLTKKK